MRLIVVARVERQRRPVDCRGRARFGQNAPQPRDAGEGLGRHAHVQGESAGEILARDAERRSERGDRQVPARAKNGPDRSVDRAIWRLVQVQAPEQRSFEGDKQCGAIGDIESIERGRAAAPEIADAGTPTKACARPGQKRTPANAARSFAPTTSGRVIVPTASDSLGPAVVEVQPRTMSMQPSGRM